MKLETSSFFDTLARNIKLGKSFTFTGLTTFSRLLLLKYIRKLSNKKILLIDADLRLSELRNEIGYEGSNIGLSDYLACITDDYNIVNVEENFDIILAGRHSPNPAELIMSPRWNEMLEDLKEQYDKHLPPDDQDAFSPKKK